MSSTSSSVVKVHKAARRRRALAVAVCLSAALIGCAHRGPSLDRLLASDAAAQVQLDDTPFFPQSDYHCGPAALATILVASGIEVVPEQLVDMVYLPARRGSLQLELLAATRSHGRVAYIIEPDPAALAAELERGRPVLVMQNLGLRTLPTWHYAVVTGYDMNRDQFMLRSGTDRSVVMRTRKFLKTWRLAQNWALVALRPGEAPARINRRRWLQGIAALDGLGRHELSIAAYEGFLARFADDPVAGLGLANAHASAAQHQQAERLYRDLLRVDPNDVAARNNLALSLAARACYAAALDEIRAAQARDRAGSAFGQILAETRIDIERRARQSVTSSPAPGSQCLDP